MLKQRLALFQTDTMNSAVYAIFGPIKSDVHGWKVQIGPTILKKEKIDELQVSKQSIFNH